MFDVKDEDYQEVILWTLGIAFIVLIIWVKCWVLI